MTATKDTLSRAEDMARRIYEAYCTTRFIHGASEDAEDMLPFTTSFVEEQARSQPDLDVDDQFAEKTEAAFRKMYL